MDGSDVEQLGESFSESLDADLGSDVKSLGLGLAGVPLWPIEFGKGEAAHDSFNNTSLK